MSEPLIVINGRWLSDSEALTVRVAIESLSTQLEDNFLGDDERGKVITQGYRDNINSIRRKMSVDCKK